MDNICKSFSYNGIDEPQTHFQVKTSQWSVRRKKGGTLRSKEEPYRLEKEDTLGVSPFEVGVLLLIEEHEGFHTGVVLIVKPKLIGLDPLDWEMI